MNQEQVKIKLLEIKNDVSDFHVIFSGKTSKKVDGLYHPEKCEIILHNKNFPDNNSLMYTAIHEFAHHIQFTESSVPVSSRAHTSHFWNILHKILIIAEENGIYDNVFKTNNEFIELTRKIKENFVNVDANLMKDFGKLLLEAFELCIKNHLCFDDYVDRELQLHRNTAKTLIKIHNKNINPEIGYENMKMVASIRDDNERELAQAAFLEGKSPDMVRTEFRIKETPDNRLDYLVNEKERIEKSIERLTFQLAKIERQINEMS